MNKENLPGVVLFLESSSIKQSSKKKWAVCRVRAEIDDDAVWAGIETKLKEGVPLYTADDFKGELLRALRKEFATMETRAIAAEQDLITMQDRYERLQVLLKETIKNMKEHLDA